MSSIYKIYTMRKTCENGLRYWFVAPLAVNTRSLWYYSSQPYWIACAQLWPPTLTNIDRYMSVSICVSVCLSVCLSVCVASEILMDIIPTIETPEVAKVLIDLIRDQTIRGIRARMSIAATSLTVIPTPEVVQSLLVSAVTWSRAPVHRISK